MSRWRSHSFRALGPTLSPVARQLSACVAYSRSRAFCHGSRRQNMYFTVIGAREYLSTGTIYAPVEPPVCHCIKSTDEPKLWLQHNLLLYTQTTSESWRTRNRDDMQALQQVNYPGVTGSCRVYFFGLAAGHGERGNLWSPFGGCLWVHFEVGHEAFVFTRAILLATPLCGRLHRENSAQPRHNNNHHPYKKSKNTLRAPFIVLCPKTFADRTGKHLFLR